MRYDAVVIGSGPAGLSAAIQFTIRKKSFLLFGSHSLSSKISAAPRIDNYLGLYGISGKDMQRHFQEHLDKMGITVTREQVTVVYPMGGYFSVATNKQVVEATTVVLAPGTFSGKLLPGEEQFLGRGVGYCATCDAPLYKGRDVAIVGYGDEAVLDANYMAELARKVYYLPMKKSQLPLSPEIEVVNDRPVSIRGEQKASALVLKNGELAVDGIFILRETIAPDTLVPGIALEGGFIHVDAAMRTNLPGCFAAGDCTGKPHQYMRAAGQGQTAALNAVAYIDTLKAKERQEQNHDRT